MINPKVIFKKQFHSQQDQKGYLGMKLTTENITYITKTLLREIKKDLTNRKNNPVDGSIDTVKTAIFLKPKDSKQSISEF